MTSPDLDRYERLISPAQVDAMLNDIAHRLSRSLLICEACRHTEMPTDAQVTEYLRKGWPEHCGRGMTLKSPGVPAQDTSADHANRE